MNKIFIMCIPILSVSMLSGCAQKTISPEIIAKAKEPVYCEGKSQCDTYWARTKAWIAMNSAWKIQNSDEIVISTYNPAEYSTAVSYQAVKNHVGGEKYEIVIQTGCANMFGCVPDENVQVAALKDYIKAN